MLRDSLNTVLAAEPGYRRCTRGLSGVLGDVEDRGIGTTEM